MRKKEYIGCLVVLVLMYAWVLPGCGRQGGVFYETAQDADGTLSGAGGGTGRTAESGAGTGNAGMEAGNGGNAAAGGTDSAGNTADGGSGVYAQDAQTPRTIYIHICGAVMHPGVYEVAEDSRLYEVIVLAGGLCADACDYLVNQAQSLTDGMQIYIPTMEEAQALADGTRTPGAGTVGGTQTFGTSAADGIQDFGAAATNGAQIPGVQGQTTQGQAMDADVSAGADVQAGQQESVARDTRLDLNSATKEQLMTLPGVGETRAGAIIAYREAHGGFRTVEELMEVNGIKQGVYDRLKEMIKV
ncbi:MAG: helix-hairpin-helix domain-containing protein [bacterium]|nr:helix-hairpin-helix domain-containing protein [bacterium]